MSSSTNTEAAIAATDAPMTLPSEDQLKKDDDVSVDPSTPKLPYRISYERHPYIIGLSMFGESESDDDDDNNKNNKTEKDDDETIGVDCQDPGKTALRQAQTLTFREAAPPTTVRNEKIIGSPVDPKH